MPPQQDNDGGCDFSSDGIIITSRSQLLPQQQQQEVFAASESTPLIACSSVESRGSCNDEENGLILLPSSKEEDFPSKHSSKDDDEHMFYDEIRGMIELAVPVVGTFLLEMLPGIVSIVLVGHVPPTTTTTSADDFLLEEEFSSQNAFASAANYVDATLISVAFVNIVGVSIGIGLATALDTLCSQAFGAKETHKMGVYLQTGVLVMLVFSMLLCLCFLRVTDVLVFLGQPPIVSHLAGIFTLYMLPGIPFLFFYELLRKVLQAQSIAAPMFWVASLSNILHIGIGYYLVYHTTLGWIGAAVARTICNISFVGFLVFYILYTGLHKTFWRGLDLSAAIQGIPNYISLGIPGTLQTCFEFWAFETTSIIAGLFPNPITSIGASAVQLNISSVLYMFYLGISVSGSVRIGNALGAADSKRASVAAKLTVGLAICVAATLASLVLLFRNSLPLLFTSDEDIDALTSKILVVTAAFQILDSINGAIQGIFRGSGRQSLGAKLNFVGYYLLGLPIGCFFGFRLHWGVVGLWIGMAFGLLLIDVCGLSFIARSDWVQLAKDAKERVES